MFISESFPLLCSSAVSQRCGALCAGQGVYCQCFVYGVVFLCGRGEQQRLCSSRPSLCVRAQRGVGERAMQDWKVLWERGDLAGPPPVCHLIYMHWHVRTPRATGGRAEGITGASGNDLPLRQSVTTPASSGTFWKVSEGESRDLGRASRGRVCKASR